MKSLILCTLSKILDNIQCFINGNIPIDLAVRSLTDQLTLAGWADVPAGTIVTHVNCLYNNTELFRFAYVKYYPDQTRAYVSINVLFDDFGVEPSVVSILDDDCASIQGCTITVNRMWKPCRLLISLPNGGTISGSAYDVPGLPPGLKIDGKPVNNYDYIEPGVHVMEFEAIWGQIPVQDTYVIKIGGYPYTFNVISGGFV